MKFTEKILKIMEERNISAYEICKNLHISQTTFTSWKKGSKPSVDKAIEILRYLQLSADEIFELNFEQKKIISDDEKELIKYFRKLPEREKGRELGRLEAKAEQYQEQEKLSSSRTG